LPAYISVAEHERILARLAANRARADSPGAARDGAGLLAGLVVCGKCRRRMSLRYARSAGRDRHSYSCARAKSDYGLPGCQEMSGAFLDAWVAGQVLAVVAPAALELATEATRRVQAERDQLQRVWQLRIERAQIACDRARRCKRPDHPRRTNGRDHLVTFWSDGRPGGSCWLHDGGGVGILPGRRSAAAPRSLWVISGRLDRRARR
jgi:hypothetical protein